MDRLTPAICLKYPDIVLDWLDRAKYDSGATICIPGITSTENSNMLDDSFHSALVDGYCEASDNSFYDTLLNETYVVADDYELIDENIYSGEFADIQKAIDEEGMKKLLQRTDNPPKELLDYVFFYSARDIKHIKTLDQEMCDYYWSSGCLNIYNIPTAFVSDKMLYDTWNVQCASIPYGIVNRDDMIELFGRNGFYAQRAIANKNKEYLFHIVKQNSSIIREVDISPELYQETALFMIRSEVIRPNSFSRINPFCFIDKHKCLDYEELCCVAINKDPKTIAFVEQPSFDMVCYAYSLISPSSDIKWVRPGVYEEYPKEFRETWPHYIFYDFDSSDEDWINVMANNPCYFLLCHRLSEDIIRAGIAFNKGQNIDEITESMGVDKIGFRI